MVGNLLDNPSLLMTMNYVRNTETVEEKLDQGEEFQKKDLQDIDQMAEERSSLQLQNYGEKVE